MDKKAGAMRLAALCAAALAVCLAGAKARGQDSVPHIGAGVSLMPARALAIDRYERMWLKGKDAFSVSAEVLYSPLPSDSCGYAEDYNFPQFAVGLQYDFDHGVTMRRSPDPAWGLAQTVDYTSRMGNILTLYSTFLRPVVRSAKWDAGYALGMGVGYSRTKYNPRNNADNELIGSRWLVYFNASLYATWHFARNWGVRGGLRFFHHSNGALNRPNKGANMVGPFLGVVYEPYHETLARRTKAAHRDFRKYLYMNLTGGVGAKTLNEDWMKTQYYTPPGEPRYRTGRFRMYVAWSFQADVMYRYARRWATGVGFDLFCATYASRVAEIDKADGLDLRHDNVSYGIALKHEVFYRRISASMEIGRYLYRHLGKDDDVVRKEFPFYERIGVRYAFPRLAGMQVGLNVKAHKFKADFTELTLGVPLVLARFK